MNYISDLIKLNLTLFCSLVPGRPERVEVFDVRATSFRTSWKSPNKSNGRITTYNGNVRLLEVLYPIPPTGCGFLGDVESKFTEPNTVFEYRVDSLLPYANYSIQVAAATSKGLGEYSDTEYTQTLTAPSDPVRNFYSIINQPQSVEIYDASITFTWQLPCRTNGELIKFELDMYGTRPDYEDHHFKTMVEVIDNNDIEYTVTDIKPAYQYNSTVTPVTNYEGRNKENFIFIRTPPSIPMNNEISDWGNVQIKEAANPTKNAQIIIMESMMKSDAGDIVYAAILLSERNCQPDPVPQSAVSFDWPDLATWKEASLVSCIPQYQTTPIRWNPLQTSRNLRSSDPYESTIFIQYLVGTADCETSRTSDYCNGPLKPGTPYAAILRVFTESGFSDTQPIYFRTGNYVF